MSEDIVSISGQMPNQLNRQAHAPSEPFEMDQQGALPKERPNHEGIGPAFILDLSPEAERLRKMSREKRPSK